MSDAASERDFSVLVVEDDPNHQLLIRRALTAAESGFSVVQLARDSDEAERFARQLRFDCILVDNRIPGRRGLDLIDALRDSGVDSPFVLMTSVGTEDLAVQAHRKRVADYVIKDPGFWNDVPQILRRVVSEDRARRREVELRERLERTNERLSELNTELQIHRAELGETRTELGGRGREIERLVSALRESEQKLQAVGQLLDHAVRLPLRRIAAAVGALAAEEEQAQPQELGDLAEELRRLGQTVERLVGTTWPEEATPCKEVVAMDDVVSALLARVADRLKLEGAVVLRGEEALPTVVGDGGVLEHALMQLVHAGVSHNAAATPQVSFRASQAPGVELPPGTVSFEVQDNGVGPSGDGAIRASRFTEVGDAWCLRPGVAVARRAVLRCGGKLYLRAAEQGGTVYLIALPAAPADASSHKTSETGE